jgi:hypothetical protein
MRNLSMSAALSIFLLAACSGAETTAETDPDVQDAMPPSPAPSARAPSRGVTAGAAAAAMPVGHTTCRGIIGRLIDPAPEGRNVRAGPGVNHQLLGVIGPPQGAADTPNGERDLPAGFQIIGSANGWLHIRGAGYDEQLAGGPMPDVYSGEGWISGRGVSVGLQTRAAFSRPSHDADILIGGGDDSYLDGIAQRGIVACDGQWVLVDWERPRGEGDPIPDMAPAALISERPYTLRAWAAGVCNTIETSCDGVDGTTAENAFRDY